MQELIRVAVDAMGGDNAPAEIVKGAVEALEASTDLKVILVGQEEAVQQELSKYQYDASRMEVVNATEIIEMAEPPVQAIRSKKDSSIVVAMKLVKNGEADAFVGAASSADRKRRFTADRLRCQCGCQTVSSGAVCKDGFHLYGKCYGCEEPKSGHRQYWCRGREGKCTGQRDFPSSESMSGY